MYHSVEPYESDPYQVTVSPERFERQMRWLRRRGLCGVSMRALLDAGGGPGLVGPREVEAVRAAGYDYGAAVYRSPLDGRHAIPRTFVGDRDGSLRLHAKVTRHRLLDARVSAAAERPGGAAAESGVKRSSRRSGRPTRPTSRG